ncbi:hypothetical protein B0H14DRAFT_813379 [Mycena olivaceomarginata]|nr:hypothetical protein B0H14DRAFT_813379 [Mycena olivaceomarginata]
MQWISSNPTFLSRLVFRLPAAMASCHVANSLRLHIGHRLVWDEHRVGMLLFATQRGPTVNLVEGLRNDMP